jgi:hypothetical protein
MVAKLNAATTSHEVHHIPVKPQPIKLAALADIAVCLSHV